ncbi:MAG: hypothetical protein JWM93_726 [Frankiales bacterium]|nr:hypothetical protein [Frankiales bacterium]
MSTATLARPGRASWTVIGRRLGVTSNHTKRSQILTAARTLEWDDSAQTPASTHPAVDAVITALFGRHRSSLAKVASVAIDSDRSLIGLQHTDGARSYLVVQGAEAILVLIDADPTIANVA